MTGTRRALAVAAVGLTLGLAYPCTANASTINSAGSQEEAPDGNIVTDSGAWLTGLTQETLTELNGLPNDVAPITSGIAGLFGQAAAY